MEKYSCFNCPSKDYSEKDLSDRCPTCGMPYGFPLDFPPNKIGSVTILKSLARGFYGATYAGETSPFGIMKVPVAVKVIPTALYQFHGKKFSEECENHLELSSNSSHIVHLRHDIYHENIAVEFGNGKVIDCHVVGMEYLDGVTLKDYLNDDGLPPARSIAQMAVDLVTLLQELRTNEKYHNDLHPGNIIIENLPPTRKRFDEIDENIKVVAIDLGSADQKTKSNDDTDRIGDLHWVARCLNLLSRKITNNLDTYDQKDWRLALLLEEKADFLKPEVIHQRQITYRDLINQIRDTFHRHTNPWKQELVLKSFDDSVNAQSLSPWHISSLFVDNDNSWTKSISIKGPQVITGMRGCGKTMLLRALEFHARLMPQNETERLLPERIISRLTDNTERYVGLYISCVKLLDFNAQRENEYNEIFEPYSKLLIGYAIQAIQSIRHLRDLNPALVRKDFFVAMAGALANLISQADELGSVSSDYDLEQRLKKYLNSLSDGKSSHRITIHPKIAFPQLAEAVKQASEVFAQSTIYFLLDDVSTRYLNDSNIIRLISELLFQDEICAFKFTTEAQTLEMVIMAPGSTSQAKIGRDYSIFDLGEEVNRIIHDDHFEGQRFIESILEKRARYFPLHPKNIPPSKILGDEKLIVIAENIVREERASQKKDLYHGVSALTAVCVGDLGDVITLYELILKKSSGSAFYPVDPKIQNSSYLQLCNSRLYDLNRRDTKYLDFVDSFAEASHHLLVQSAIRKARGEADRLRQYTSIFINITHGDKERQYRQVRQLIDAGIFNLQGGPEASRTNRQGVKPQQQFKLVFRKLYGISKHIGLSSSDRFELSGESLEEWLSNPKGGKRILIKNLNPISDEELPRLLSETTFASEPETSHPVSQLFLFQDTIDVAGSSALDSRFIINKLPVITELDFNANLPRIDIAIVGLGFEDAALHSARQIAKLTPQTIIFLKFPEQGLSHEILKEFDFMPDHRKKIVPIEDFNAVHSLLVSKNVLCDITGLPKGIIFDAIRSTYSQNRSLLISLSTPDFEYPLNEDVGQFIDSTNENDTSELLEKMASVLKGEKGPYTLSNLLPHYTNISEPRVLFAFASAKHERLYTLLDERDYEQINIVVTNGFEPRDVLARRSAEFSLRKFSSASIYYLNQNDLTAILQQLGKDYYNYFVVNNLPFEIGLTGTKIQSAAAALFASVFKVSQCWYVKPEIWDTNKFSKGASAFSLFKVN
jgi:serine/threonine protein kinase